MRHLSRIACALFLVGCGRGSSGPSGLGTPDRATVGGVTVDESGITAAFEGGGLVVHVPVGADAGAGGRLKLSLTRVDGGPALSTTLGSYQVAAGKAGEVVATLAAPPALAGQADLVRYNLVVEDALPTPGGLRVTRSLLAAVAPHEVALSGPSTVTRGRKVTYRVRTQDPRSHLILAGVPVQLDVRKGDLTVAQRQGRTGPTGDAVFELVLDVEGPVKVAAHSLTLGTSAAIEGDATVERAGAKVLLTTDKPIYQPAQTIHLRALALDSSSQKPVVGQPVVFEIADGKGNKILKRTLQSDGYGLASTDFVLGPVLNLGTFKVAVAVGEDRTEKTVEVARYALPKFKVEVSADRPWYAPGETIGGTVDAHYFFGKAAGDAEVVIEGAALDIGASVFGRVVGRTGPDGRFAFSLMLPSSLVGLPLQQGSALATLEAQVTDGAGQKVVKDLAITVASNGLRLALVPEATVLVPGMENRLDLFVTNPLGEPVAGVAAELVGPVSQTARTDLFGHAAFTFTPGGPGTVGASVRVTDQNGKVVSENFTFDAQAGGRHVLVRTDRAVYNLGDTVSVEVRTSADRSAVYVDWINAGQAVEMRTLDVTDGVAHFESAIDPGRLGASRIEAYVVDADGNVVRAGRSIFARGQGALSVDVTGDQPQYTPGAPARLTFTVKDETGAPAVAALGVQIVDEAVFALADAQPGLLRSYFQLEQAFSQPHYQIRAPAGDLPQLLFDGTAKGDPAAVAAAQTRAAASLAALGGGGYMGLEAASWPSVITAANTILAPLYQAEKQRLIPLVRQATTAALDDLANAGCTPNVYYCSQQNTYFMAALQKAVQQRLVVSDFWGSRYQSSGQAAFNEVLRLSSGGPDEKIGTDDDGSFAVTIDEVGLPNLAVFGGANGGPGGPPAGLPGAAGPMAAGGAAAAPSTPPPAGPAEPRVRSDFPETLYVNPAVITGPDGVAQVSLDVADSITDWRISTLAHSASGKLGGGVGSLRVFQEFFVDVDFPAALTRGDELDFPVAVYNYLDQPQTVHVELVPAAWYTPRGPTAQDIPLAPGQVTGVRFPVRVEGVGRQTLTVKGTGGARSDAVARSVLVRPDGKTVVVARSAALSAGAVTEPVTFPPLAVAGSQQLTLDVFPAFLAQVVAGMDSMLAVPNGCFEQTTSTAWPNVLVTDYLKATNQLKPEIALKAESLMSAGYQRLLTFEHKGGGYSWFGEQDPAPYLSVTAFGVMEFSDMAKVHPIDEAMLERTRAWLVAQQQADGSWKGDRSEFFTFQTSLLRNTAFVVWALASAGYQGPALNRGLAFVKQQLDMETLDAYSLAIVANAFATAAPANPTLTSVMAKLDKLQQGSGDKAWWDSSGTQTNFYGNGGDAKVATTALVVQALLNAGGDKTTVDRGLAFLVGSRDGSGNFGSTQATIWTLRALLLASRKGTEPAVGTFAVDVDGQPFTGLTLTADQSDVMTTVDLSSLATPGDHRVGLRFAGSGKVSYNLVARHNLPWEMMPPGTGLLGVTVSYDKSQLAVDDTATATVTVRNNTRSRQDMILVTLGLPPGFQVQTEDLDAYKAARTLSDYELTGKQILLYLTGLDPSATEELKYRLRAVMPVKASDGGGEVYLYYQPEQRTAYRATTLQVTAGP